MPSTDDDRRALHAYLSVAGHERWDDFTREHGLSITAALEAFSEQLPRKTPIQLLPDEKGTPPLVVRRAREIDGERRRRSRQRRAAS